MWFTIIFTAQADGWQLSPDALPTSLDGDVFVFAETLHLRVRSGIVLSLHEDHAPPTTGHSLGGRSWLVETSSAEQAIRDTPYWQNQPGVAAAFPDVYLPKQRQQFDDPGYPGQWYLADLEAESLFAISLGSEAVRVAVIDSGIDIDHPDLADHYLSPFDAHADDDDPRPDPGAFCHGASQEICDDHGTAVSGVILAAANNASGIVGLCPNCTLIPIKMLGDGAGAMSADIAAFEHAISMDAAVINNSWGYTSSIPVPAPLANVIERATVEPRDGKGAVVVFAAGNDDREINDNELQALDTVLCVSATDSYGRPTAYTNEGNAVDIAAPSATVSIAPNETITTTFGGTSAAAPVVSGVAAWLLSVAPELTEAEVRALLISSAEPSPLVTHDDSGHHPIYGFGELSIPNLLDTLYPEADDSGLTPAEGCACQAIPSPMGALFGVLAGLWGVSRRKSAIHIAPKD